MNTEYVLNNIKTVLNTYLDSTIDTLEVESSAVERMDVIQESKVGDFMPTEFTSYPSFAVQAQRSSSRDDQYQYQERSVHFAVVGWVVHVDNETLHRWICRMGDAIVRILRKETNWVSTLNTPLITDATYSDVFTVNHGLAQGCQVLGSVNYIISNY